MKKLLRKYYTMPASSLHGYAGYTAGSLRKMCSIRRRTTPFFVPFFLNSVSMAPSDVLQMSFSDGSFVSLSVRLCVWYKGSAFVNCVDKNPQKQRTYAETYSLAVPGQSKPFHTIPPHNFNNTRHGYVTSGLACLRSFKHFDLSYEKDNA